MFDLHITLFGYPFIMLPLLVLSMINLKCHVCYLEYLTLNYNYFEGND